MLNEHEVKTIFFDPEINRFIDECGNIIHDINRLVSPGAVTIFKEHKNIYITPDVTNSFLVEMIYPDGED